MDGFPSGQRGQTVNLLATLSVVRIHLHPLEIRCESVGFFVLIRLLSSSFSKKRTSICHNSQAVAESQESYHLEYPNITNLYAENFGFRVVNFCGGI